tara:strand:- start:949 stop:1305 length:357 start_codon:yes stop_codon:yes gene_type:complete
VLPRVTHTNENSSHDLTSLKLICNSSNTKLGFEFINQSMLVEYKYYKNNGEIETTKNKLYYLTDNKYIHLEKIHQELGSYFRINRESFFLNDRKENKCIMIRTPILEFFSNLKKQQFN